MKNQYFADRRDLLKYDLVLELAAALPQLRQLTLVPMLTPNDTGTDGRLTSYARGPFREDVFAFLRECLASGRRDIRELRRLFDNRPFQYLPYGDGALFSGDRGAYFAGVPDAALQSALIFFDPDNGLEPAGGAERRHLRYAELGAIMDRADDHSVAVIVQFLPREQRSATFKRVGERLAEALPDHVFVAVHDSNLALVLVLRREHMRDVLQWLPNYASVRGLTTWPTGAVNVQPFQLDRPHFGYGSNMCDPWLRRHAPSAVARGRGILAQHRLTFEKESGDGSAKSTIAWSDGSSVHGVLFDIAPPDLPLLNTKEGGYVVRKVVVESAGADVPAWTYVAAPVRTSLRPFEWYVALIVAGADHHGVPKDYSRPIADTPTTPDSDRERAEEAERCIEALLVPESKSARSEHGQEGPGEAVPDRPQV